MASGYIALIVFVVIAVVVPVSLILTSILLRIKKRQNSVSGLNFESGERSTGIRIGIMQEYFHYFTGFMAFEIVTVVFVLWVYVEGLLTARIDYYVLGFLGFSLLLEYFVVLLALRRVNE